MGGAEEPGETRAHACVKPSNAGSTNFSRGHGALRIYGDVLLSGPILWAGYLFFCWTGPTLRPNLLVVGQLFAFGLYR